MSNISSQLVGKNAIQRSAIKVTALQAAAAKALPVSYTLNGVDIVIKEIGIEHGMLRIVASATLRGKSLPINNPLYYVNPPILVPDGTIRQVVIDGLQTLIANCREDPVEALKQIVCETICITCGVK